MSQKIEAPFCAVPCLLSPSRSRPGRSLGSSVRYLGNDSQRLLKVNSPRFGNAPNSAAPICRSLTKKDLGGDPARPVDCLPNHPHSEQRLQLFRTAKFVCSPCQFLRSLCAQMRVTKKAGPFG